MTISDNDTIAKINEIEAAEENKKALIRKYLDNELKMNGYYPALKSEMGYSNFEGKETLIPSYSAVHTINYLGNKAHIKMGSEMPFMMDKIDTKTGKVVIDAEIVEKIQQRAPDWTRQPELTSYLLRDKNRKFTTILAVVSPSWIEEPKHENWGPDGRALKSAIEFKPLDSEGLIGLIKLDDTDAYALDGQHRIMGIRGLVDLQDGKLEIRKTDGTATQKKFTKAEFFSDFKVSNSHLTKIFEEKMSVEYIPAVVKGETIEEARKRLRSIFVTINKYAKKIDKGEAITLDENDGYSMVARKVGINHKLFKNSESPINWKSTTISERSLNITTIQALRDMIFKYINETHLNIKQEWTPKLKGSVPIAPDEESFEFVENIFNKLLDHMYDLDVFQRIIRGDHITNIRQFPTTTSTSNEGHLLVRPIGQTILIHAVGKIMGRDENHMTLDQIFEKINKLDNNGGFQQNDPKNVWYKVTFDPQGKGRMITSNQELASKLLKYLILGDTHQNQQELEQIVKDLRTDENGNWTDFAGNNLSVDDSNSVSRLPVPIG